ncbi:hypothetical protein [Amycolatopsis taiwanensis]|uniref:hypothetical protein n=1 Tax=Amycolatopsis taiwanensis TaxID=342230 RepID=UPI0004843337|nr:hypothetical protein [Amycolatopsis taiwanensis]
MTSSYEEWLAQAEQRERMWAAAERRVGRYRKLAEYGVEQKIEGGCGTVRVNAAGVVLGIELDLTNARTAGEEVLAARLVAALAAARKRAGRLQELISEQ